MTKTIFMLIGLACAVAAGAACAGVFSRNPPPAETQVEACAGLSGQAKIDCERRQGH